jgi:hypothetical protein
MGASTARWFGWLVVVLTLAASVADSAPLNMAPEEEAVPPLAALRAKAQAFHESPEGKWAHIKEMEAAAEHAYGAPPPSLWLDRPPYQSDATM